MPCRAKPCSTCGSPHHIAMCPRDKKGQTMLVGPKVEEKKDDQDANDNRGEDYYDNQDIEDGQANFDQEGYKEDPGNDDFYDLEDGRYEGKNLLDDYDMTYDVETASNLIAGFDETNSKSKSKSKQVVSNSVPRGRAE